MYSGTGAFGRGPSGGAGASSGRGPSGASGGVRVAAASPGAGARPLHWSAAPRSHHAAPLHWSGSGGGWGGGGGGWRRRGWGGRGWGGGWWPYYGGGYPVYYGDTYPLMILEEEDEIPAVDVGRKPRQITPAAPPVIRMQAAPQPSMIPSPDVAMSIAGPVGAMLARAWGVVR